jgi:hypothetical protein
MVSLGQFKGFKEAGSNHQHHTDFFKYGNQRGGTLKAPKKWASRALASLSYGANSLMVYKHGSNH